MWEVATTTDFDEWFAELDDVVHIEIIAKVTLLKQLGRRLSRPHADTLHASRHPNMKELRADTADKVMRIAFAFDPHRSAILLIGGNKTGISERLFYRQLIQRADRLYDEHLAAIEPRKKKDR